MGWSKLVTDVCGRFTWYELMTTEVESARTFYSRVVGWEAHDISQPGMTYTLFTAGDDVVCGLMRLAGEARDAGASPRWIGYVRVDDVDAAVERVRRLGGAVHVRPTDVPGTSRFSICADPQTAPLGLIQWYRERSAQPDAASLSGRIGWHELVAADWERALPFYTALFDWRQTGTDTDESGAYALFSAGGETIGGMFNKPATVPTAFWLYYFNVGDIDMAVKRVQVGGGEILAGPHETPDGNWVVHCRDPQAAVFALTGKRRRNAIGYFKRQSRNPSDKKERRWSW
jgi:uncharacterized protein